MTERLCSWGENGALTNGKPTPEYLKLYEEWGAGAIGTIVLVRNPSFDLRAILTLLIRRETFLSMYDTLKRRRTLLSTEMRHGTMLPPLRPSLLLRRRTDPSASLSSPTPVSLVSSITARQVLTLTIDRSTNVYGLYRPASQLFEHPSSANGRNDL